MLIVLLIVVLLIVVSISYFSFIATVTSLSVPSWEP